MLHGEERADEYAWLRNGSDPWVEQVLHRRARKRGAQSLATGAELVAEYTGFVQRHFAAPQPHDFSVRGVHFRWRGSRLERRADARGRWRTVFDTEVYGARAGGGGVTNVALSPDGRMLAISLHRSGTERWMLRVRDVERGRDLRLSVEEVGPNAAWVGDQRVLLSRVDATGRPVSIHLFDLETGLGPPIFASRHANAWLSIGQLADGVHAVVSGEELWLAGPETTTALTRIDLPFGSEPTGMSYCSRATSAGRAHARR